jgi:hypothetical protein
MPQWIALLLVAAVAAGPSLAQPTLKTVQQDGSGAALLQQLEVAPTAAPLTETALPPDAAAIAAGKKGGKPPSKGTAHGERAYMRFTPKGKQEVKAENVQKHDGESRCENCDVKTVEAQKSQKGITPPGNETQVDHVIPKVKGGDGSPSNGQVLCRECNNEKSDKL